MKVKLIADGMGSRFGLAVQIVFEGWLASQNRQGKMNFELGE